MDFRFATIEDARRGFRGYAIALELAPDEDS